MPHGLILAIDQGTTNTKASLIGPDAVPIFRTAIPVTLLQPQPGFVEQDPNELWLSVRTVMEQCAAHAAQLGQPIEAIAISNQRETAVAWTAPPGQPPTALANAVSWQCRRSAPLCDALTPHHALIQQLSGLPVDPLLTAGKWSWLLENLPEHHPAPATHLGTVDSWLLANLTNSTTHATDLTNASRTGLLDLATLTWSRKLCTLFNIPLASLPQLRPSASNFGLCTSIPALAGVPILSVIGDSHAALAGHGSYTPGTVKATYGTGSSLMTLTPALPPHTPTLARTIAWSTANHVQYALEGNIAMAGAALQWVGEFLALPSPAADAAALSASVPSSEGLYFVPAMVGLGAPHWDTAARGSITRLERSHRAPHLARAAVEAIAFQVADVFFALESAAGTPLPALRADGGAARNDTLMQFQADLLNRPVLRSINDDLSLLGAAALAGITLGWWPSLQAFAAHTGDTQTFTPAISPAHRATLLEGWRHALTTARSTPHPQATS